MDKKSFQRMYEAKWGGAPWVNEKDHREGNRGEDEGGVVVIDTAPPACPEGAAEISPSRRASSSLDSRKSTE
jgi:hypothetical protein